MTSTTAITSIAASCQSGVLNETSFENSDELMLEELERRDGIYSFIFHELESPKVIKTSESEIIQNSSPFRNGRRSSLNNKINLKKVELSQQFDTAITTKMTSANLTTSTKTISSLMNGSGEVNVVPSSSASASASVSTSASAIVTATLKENSTKLPSQNELFRYQQYLKTWYPPPPTPPIVSSRQINFIKTSPTTTIGGSSPFYLNKRQTNLYVCMMNCGVSVRPQPPRFSHITEPLVRNRRHALKENEEYKRRTNLHAPRAPDLRALFPYDPDVHAPFLTGRNGTLGCLKTESDIKSDESKLLATCNEIK